MINSLPTPTTADVRALPAEVDTLAAADRVLRVQAGVSLATVRRNLRAAYAAASPRARRAGRRWYRVAARLSARLEAAYGLPAGVGACLLAACSPRTRWADNVAHAYAVARGERPLGIMGANYDRAVAVLDAVAYGRAVGDVPATTLMRARAALGNGPKVRAFAINCSGDETSAVTIDVWAVRAALAPNWSRGAESGAMADKALTRRGVYDALALAYAAEARRAGVTPAEFQAIVWCHISGAA